MRRTVYAIFCMMLSCHAFAQTLNVNLGQVTYAYQAASVGDAAVSTSTVTIGSKAYQISDISSIKVEDSTVEDNTVSVTYSGSSATVVIAGNLDDIVTAKVSGAHVTLLQGDATDEITYTLSGTTTDGSLYMDGSLKATFVLDGVSISNPDSAAINIQDGKRIEFVLSEGTTNTLSDGLSGTDDGTDAHKACLYVQGHTEFSGAGTLTVNGNVKHGITSHEYCQVKKSAGTITVKASAGDGLHVGQYYEQRGGTVTVTAGSDGLDVSLDDDDTAENNGQVIISGGELDITVTSDESDALKCEDDFSMTAGTVTLLATGAGGRAMNIDGKVAISGGYIEGVASGAVYDSGGDDERKPHALSADESITISGGEAYFASAKNKAFKTDSMLLLNGGTIMGIGGKSTTPAAASSQGYSTYTGKSVTAGSTVSYDGVSFTVPSSFSVSSAYILVSASGM